jgi:hypothetical protein
MREVLQSGFIPFTFDAASTTPNGNNVSAEFSCANDGLNYDNWEFIRNPQAGHTYYCVAFNAPTPTPGGNGGGGTTDVCSNIAGVQAVLPAGFTVNAGICTAIGGGGTGGDTDLCPNIDGIQTTLPDGDVIGSDGTCQFVGGVGGGGLPTGSTGGHSHSSTNNFGVGGGGGTPQGQVLGAATSTIPVGAPNTGAGGMADLTTSLGALIALMGFALIGFAARKKA